MQKKDGIVTSIFGFSTLSVVTAFVGFLVIPLLTRLVSTEDIGKISMVQTIVTILMPCICLGLDHGYIRNYCELDAERSKKLFSASVFLSAGTLTLVFLFACCLWRKISVYVVGVERFDVIVMILVSTIAYMFERYLLTQERLRNRVGRYAMVSILFMLANKVLYVFAAYIWKDYFSLLYVIVVCDVVAVFISLLMSRQYFTFQLCSREDISNSMRFGMPIMGSFVITLLTQYAPRFFVRSYLDFSNVGIYSTAVTIAGVVTVMQNGFSLVWTPYVYENYRTKGEEINDLQESLVTVLIIFVTGVIFCQQLIAVILGDAYQAILGYLPFLLLVPSLTAIGEITGIGINIARKTRLHIVNNIAAVLVTLLLSWLLVPRWGCTGAALSSVAGSLTLLVMRTLESRKLYMPVRNFSTIIIGLVLLSLMAAANAMFYANPLPRYLSFAAIILAEGIALHKNLMRLLKRVLG